MIYDNLLFAVGEPAASALRPDFEKSYEEAWQNVRDYVFRENFCERQVDFAEVE